jgi:hypothetical protein
METFRTKLLIPVGGTLVLVQLCSIFWTFAALTNRLVFAQENADPSPSYSQAPSTSASIFSVGTPGTLTLRPLLQDGVTIQRLKRSLKTT